MPTVGEAILLARGAGPDATGYFEAVATHRRGLARALLSSNESEQALAQRTNEIAELAAWSLTWDPTAEDLELGQQILERWARGPAPAPNVLMAAMALAPAHHFPDPPRLAQIPPWLRLHYARFLLSMPAAFLMAGEADRYAAHSVKAMTALHVAIFEDRLPDSPALAAIVCGSDSSRIYYNEQPLKAYFKARAEIAEWRFLRQGFPLGAAFPLRLNNPPRIGILHRSLAPATETYCLLGRLKGRDKTAAQVTIYLIDEPPANPLLEEFSPWVDAFVQLPQDVLAAVGLIRQDQLDVCLIGTNVTWGFPTGTQIAAHRLARVQVIGGSSPVTTGFSNSDCFLSSEANDPLPDAQGDYEEGLIRVPGAEAYFAYLDDNKPRTVFYSRDDLGVREDQIVFFSAATLYKLTPEVLRAWAEILARTPDSTVVLMPFNPNWGANYPAALFRHSVRRALLQAGVAPSRARLVNNGAGRADLHHIMSLADIYLDSFPFSGALSIVDPLMVGLPVVAHNGKRLRCVSAASVLQVVGLEGSICPNVDTYIDRAVRLGRDPILRGEEAELVRQAGNPSLACLRSEQAARNFSTFCTPAVAASRDHVEYLCAASPDVLKASIIQLAAIALAHPTPLYRGLDGVQIGRQLLLPYLQTLSSDRTPGQRIASFAAHDGELVRLFLDAGIDEAWSGANMSGARDPADVVETIGTNLPQIDFDVTSPKAMLVTFPKLGGSQRRSDVGRMLKEMSDRGFGAIVLSYVGGGEDETVWGEELRGLALGSEALDNLADVTWRVLLYRAEDSTFLACVVQLLETLIPAQLRPVVATLTGREN